MYSIGSCFKAREILAKCALPWRSRSTPFANLHLFLASSSRSAELVHLAEAPPVASVMQLTGNFLRSFQITHMSGPARDWSKFHNLQHVKLPLITPTANSRLWIICGRGGWMIAIIHACIKYCWLWKLHWSLWEDQYKAYLEVVSGSRILKSWTKMVWKQAVISENITPTS